MSDSNPNPNPASKTVRKDSSNASYLVAITGATGLVGGNLASYLLACGYRVRAIGRSKEKLEELKRSLEPAPDADSLEIAVSEITDPTYLDKAFTGCDVVVHAAGSVDPYGSRESIFKTNLGGTKNALSTAIACNVKHFIHVSSLSVITGQDDMYNVDESAPLRSCGESYADSKVEAERWVMEHSREEDIEVTSVRPGFIYGPGERAWLPRLIASIEGGKAMLIDGGSKETNVIYVENLSRAIEKAILNSTAYGQVYNLTDGAKITKKQLFDAIADGMGLPRVEKRIPGAVAKTACEVISTLAPFLPVEKQRSLSRFSRAAFRLAGINQGFSIAKAEKELGYVKRISFEEGMRTTLEAFKNGIVTKEKMDNSKVLSEGRG